MSSPITTVLCPGCDEDVELEAYFPLRLYPEVAEHRVVAHDALAGTVVTHSNGRAVDARLRNRCPWSGAVVETGEPS